jgi:amino acid adenylation domain-containing protein
VTRRLEGLVSAQAERRPDAIALVMGDQRVTYGELEERSNRLANLMLAAGCEPGDRVALFTPKCPRAIVGMLATLKAGAAYVPVDAASPPQRVARVLGACSPKFALLARESLGQLDRAFAEAGGPDCRVIALEEGRLAGERFESAFDLSDVARAPATRPAPRGDESTLAHILFTSGSTGVPKGVMIQHRSVLAFLDWAWAYFGTKAGERISGHPPLHFDLSTFDIYGTLGAGAELHLVGPELSLLAHKLADFIRATELTQWFSVPSILTYMAKFDVVKQGDFPALERLLWCGEVLPTPTLIYWMKRLKHVRFTNLYGPTEATIASSYHTVPAVPTDERAPIPIGAACGGEELLVLDANLKPVRAGEMGDLYLGGAGLSPGYWQDAEKTAAAFVEDPRRTLERIYKTGDLASVGEDGLVYFHGRRDSQIKSRGYRIELGEIETALAALPVLKDSAVVGVETGGFEGTAICCAYVAAEPGLKPMRIRSELSRHVPAYMLPTQWMELDVLPKNQNGKTDRPRLRELFAERASSRVPE